MFALVQFLIDKVKVIVPLEDIKDHDKVSLLEESDFSRPYEVFWKSPNGSDEGTGYWFAVILLVAESKESIEKRQKRIKLPTAKRLEELLAMSLNGEKNQVVAEKETKIKRKDIQEKRSACEKEKLHAILKDKKKQRKRSNPFELEHGEEQSASKLPKRCFSPADSSDGDDLVLRSELDKMKAECDRMNRKLKLKHEENIQLKKNNNKLQELNFRLQGQVLSLLSANRGKEQSITVPLQKETYADTLHLPVAMNEESSLLDKIPPPEDAPGKDICVADLDKEINVSVVENSIPSSSYTTEESGGNVQIINEEMVLAPGVNIQRDMWSKITAGKNLTESRLVRNLAVALWGTETLKDRSVTGAACRRFKKQTEAVEAKQALTPIKVEAVKNGLEFWLQTCKGKESGEAHKLASFSVVRKMLSDKIMDVNKKEKKLNQSSV